MFHQLSRLKGILPHRGFTLVEILVVVAIMAVVMTIGIPSIFRVIKKGPMAQAVSDVVDGCDKARGAAILDGIPTELIFDAVDGRFVLSVRTAPQWASSSNQEDGEIQVIGQGKAVSASGGFKATLHEDIVLREMFINQRDFLDSSVTESDDARIRFFPNGVCDEMNILLSYESTYMKIILDPVTGVTDVEKIRE